MFQFACASIYVYDIDFAISKNSKTDLKGMTSSRRGGIVPRLHYPGMKSRLQAVKWKQHSRETSHGCQYRPPLSAEAPRAFKGAVSLPAATRGQGRHGGGSMHGLDNYFKRQGRAGESRHKPECGHRDRNHVRKDGH